MPKHRSPEHPEVSRISPADALPDVVERLVSRRQYRPDDGDVLIIRERVPRLNPRAQFPQPWRYRVTVRGTIEQYTFTSFPHAASEAEHVASTRNARVVYIEDGVPTGTRGLSSLTRTRIAAGLGHSRSRSLDPSLLSSFLAPVVVVDSCAWRGLEVAVSAKDEQEGSTMSVVPLRVAAAVSLLKNWLVQMRAPAAAAALILSASLNVEAQAPILGPYDVIGVDYPYRSFTGQAIARFEVQYNGGQWTSVGIPPVYAASDGVTTDRSSQRCQRVTMRCRFVCAMLGVAAHRPAHSLS